MPAQTKKIIDGAADKLRRRYSTMFKPSSACRTPHMNIDNLRDELFQVSPCLRACVRVRVCLSIVRVGCVRVVFHQDEFSRRCAKEKTELCEEDAWIGRDR